MGTIESLLSFLQIDFDNKFAILPAEATVLYLIVPVTLVYLGGMTLSIDRACSCENSYF